MTVEAGTLVRLGNALLANIATDLVAGGLTEPTRKYLSLGRPARPTCGQLCVWWGSIQPGQGGRTSPLGQYVQNIPKHVTHVVTWNVDLSVCPTAGSLGPDPTVAVLQADGELGAEYGWVLYRALCARWTSGTMFAPVAAPGGLEGTPPFVPPPTVDGGMLTATATFAFNTRDVGP